MAWVRCGAGGRGGNYTDEISLGTESDGRINNTTGALDEGEEYLFWKTTDFIDVGDRRVIYFISNMRMDYMGKSYGAAYDENMDFITDVMGSFEMLLPAGTKYFRVSCYVPAEGTYWEYKVIGEVE